MPQMRGGSSEASGLSLADRGKDNQREKTALDQIRRDWIVEYDKLFTDDELSGDGNIEQRIVSSLIHTLPAATIRSLTNSGYKSDRAVFIQPTPVFSSDIVSIITPEDVSFFSDIDYDAQVESIKTSGLSRSSIPYPGPSSLLNTLIFKPSPTYKELPTTPEWALTPSSSQKISSREHYDRSFHYNIVPSFPTGPTSSSLLNISPSFVTPTEAFVLLRSTTKACTAPAIESSFRCNSNLDIEEDIETSLIETDFRLLHLTSTSTQLTSEHTAFPIVQQLSPNLERNAMISTDSEHGIVSVTVATIIPIFEDHNKNSVRNPTREVTTRSNKIYSSAPLSSESLEQTAATKNPTESQQDQYELREFEFTDQIYPSENEMKHTSGIIPIRSSNLPDNTHMALPFSLYSSFNETSNVLENRSAFENSTTVFTTQSQPSLSVSKTNKNWTVEESEINSILQASSHHSNISIAEAPSRVQFNFHSLTEYSPQILSPTFSTRVPTVSQIVTNRDHGQATVSSSAMNVPSLLSPTFLDYASLYNSNTEVSTFHKITNSQLFTQPPISGRSIIEFNVPTSNSRQFISYFMDSTDDLSSVNISPTIAINEEIGEKNTARAARDSSTKNNNDKPQLKRPDSQKINPVRSSSNHILSSAALNFELFKTMQSKTETSTNPTERSSHVTGFPFELSLNTRKELLEPTSSEYEYDEQVPFIFTTDRVGQKLTSMSTISTKFLLHSSTIPDPLYTTTIATLPTIPVDTSSTKTTDISHSIRITTNSGFSSSESSSFMDKTKNSIQTVPTTPNMIWTTSDNYSSSIGIQETVTPTTTSSQIQPNTNRQTNTPTEVSTTKAVMGSRENSKQPDKKFWIRTVIEADPSWLPSNFSTIMEERLEVVYEQAFEKRENIHFGFHRKKRQATWKGRIDIQLWNYTGDSDLKHVMLVYTVSRDGKPILAPIAVKDVELLRSDDVTLMLGYVVVTRAEAYLEPPEKQSEKTPEWVTYAVLGGLGGFVVFVITCLIIYCRCCRPRGPPPTQVEQPDVSYSYGQQNLQQVFEKGTVRLDLRGETKDGTEFKEKISKECENFRPLPVPPERQPDEPVKCNEERSSSSKKALKTRSNQ
ncbi:probable GPI-anchored adhesin-like protein PGA55, partial [Limulus polyphemus]|uniref:Probable GPI-anchored adhesin-like protein PGA55 n=1 Tax=Limulus polyphemus TaxID=6850 RepID=A0ABM1TM29_LIMPO